MKHTLGRHKRLYGLFRDTHTEKYRHDLVLSYSDGRTDNSADLSDLETDELIHHLESMLSEKPKRDENKPTHSGVDYLGQRQRRRILSLCYTIGWVAWDHNLKKHTVDMVRLDAWMLKHGHLHKPLNDYDHFELKRLVAQFEILAEETLCHVK